MVIYKVTNRVNGKLYIGQTIGSLEKRKSAHISSALTIRNNIYFYNAIRKYGPDSFQWKIICRCNTVDDLNKCEVYYIKYYNTFNNGYNLTKGGEGKVGCIPSKETRKKLSEATRGKNNPNYGKYHSDETKRKMSEARIGKYKGKDHPNYGKKMSEDQKKKISEARKGRYAGKDNPKARAVIINNKYFDTRKEAAKCLGVTPALIRYRIMHETKWLDYSYAQI